MTTVQRQPPITAVGKERLRRELAVLEQQREALNARLREEMQDRDDSFNRYLTHEELAQIDARIVHIEALLDGADEADVPFVLDGVVAVGSRVTVRDEAGKEQNLTIVAPIETDPGKGFISFTSPVGAGLLGRAVGDEVTVRVPRGERQFTVVGID